MVLFFGLAVLAYALGMNLFSSSSTLNGFQRFLEAFSLVGGSYIVLNEARRNWKGLNETERGRFTALGIAVQIVTLVYLTDEFYRAVNDGRLFASFENPLQALQVGISILWAVYGAAALAAGMFNNWKGIRLFSLILLLVATGKLTLVDFFSLGTGFRVVGFTILGAILISASFLYQKKKEALKSFFVSPS